MSNISINDFAKVVTKGLEEYSQQVADNIKNVVDIVGKEVNNEIKKHINFKQPSGRYVKSFRVKTTSESRYNKKNTWHVVNGQYRLTHLLEKGHALRGGGRSRAFPHIKYGDELAQRRMMELSEEAIEDAGN